MTPDQEKAASPCQGEAAQQSIVKPQSSKKIDRVTEALKLSRGLNRFEAERIGDHCLNSTIADLRKIYGSRIVQRWEQVPSRFKAQGVKVLRYWIA